MWKLACQRIRPVTHNKKRQAQNVAELGTRQLFQWGTTMKMLLGLMWAVLASESAAKLKEFEILDLTESEIEKKLSSQVTPPQPSSPSSTHDSNCIRFRSEEAGSRTAGRSPMTSTARQRPTKRSGKR